MRDSYSDRIDPIQALYALGDGYCITRLPDCFPHYRQGSDLDILVPDAVVACQLMLPRLRAMTGVDVRYIGLDYRTHLDVLMPDGTIDLRYDLCSSPYPIASGALVHDAILSADVRYGVRVPTDPHECVLHLLEYMAHPEKIRHRDWAATHWTPEAADLWKRYIMPKGL